jgi:hypothetical protein
MKLLKLFTPFRQSPNNTEIEKLKKENSELKERMIKKEKEIEQKLSVMSHTGDKTKGMVGASKDSAAASQGQAEAGETTQKKKKIGEILLAHNLITKDMLNRALEYQDQCGCSITQYLLAYGYIDEHQLAQCLCTQFGIPYLPLTSYDISDEIIKLVPADIAQKYWLIPVDRRGDALMVVMIDPLDAKAVKEVEDVTGYKVMPFVGIISEIVEALEVYYKIRVREREAKNEKAPPFFINTRTYKGIERRRSIRFKTKIDIRFPVNGYYKTSQTVNVSRGGLSFESEDALSVGSIIPVEIILSKSFSPLPILAIMQVVRAVLLDNNRFEICVKVIKISKQELTTLIEYASIHNEE